MDAEQLDLTIFESSVLTKLQSILKDECSERNYECSVKMASKPGDNYLGLVYRVVVKCSSKENEAEESVMHIIVKVPPDNEIRRNRFFARPCFLREALAYDQFLPLMGKYQEEKGLSSSEIFSAYARCFGTSVADHQEAIFMEDMCAKGYSLHDRFKELSYEHVALVMRQYAKLHAMSLVLSHQQQDAFKPFQHLPDIVAQRDDEPMLIYYEELIKRTIGSLDAPGDKKYQEHLKNYFEKEKFHTLLSRLVNGEDAEPYAVVCHGDCWNNNLLFQYEGEQPVNVCLLDWQMMRYASPITDIMYFLYTSTSRTFRQQYYEEMLDLYYKTLSTHMERFNCQAEIVFPREIFERQLEKYGASGLIFAMMVLPLVTTRPEHLPNLDELGELLEAGGTVKDAKNTSLLDGGESSLYNMRMRDVVIDMIQNNYI